MTLNISETPAKLGGLILDSSPNYSNLAIIAASFERLGRKLDLFLVDFNHPRVSNTYNPVLTASGAQLEAMFQAPTEGYTPGSAYFRNLSKYSLTILVDAIRAGQRLSTPDDLLVLLASPAAVEDLRRCLRTPEEKKPLDIWVERLLIRNKSGVSLSREKFLAATDGAATQLAMLTLSNNKNIFNTYTPDVQFSQVVAERNLVYVKLPFLATEEDRVQLRHILLTDFKAALASRFGLGRFDQALRKMDPKSDFVGLFDDAGLSIKAGDFKLWFEPNVLDNAAPAYVPVSRTRQLNPGHLPLLFGERYSQFMSIAQADAASGGFQSSPISDSRPASLPPEAITELTATLTAAIRPTLSKLKFPAYSKRQPPPLAMKQGTQIFVSEYNFRALVFAALGADVQKQFRITFSYAISECLISALINLKWLAVYEQAPPEKGSGHVWELQVDGNSLKGYIALNLPVEFARELKGNDYPSRIIMVPAKVSAKSDPLGDVLRPRIR